jgi:hypothetical protein
VPKAEYNAAEKGFRIDGAAWMWRF